MTGKYYPPIFMLCFIVECSKFEWNVENSLASASKSRPVSSPFISRHSFVSREFFSASALAQDPGVSVLPFGTHCIRGLALCDLHSVSVCSSSICFPVSSVSWEDISVLCCVPALSSAALSQPFISWVRIVFLAPKPFLFHQHPFSHLYFSDLVKVI